jgi:uncharacterized protein (TIGR02246 family)
MKTHSLLPGFIVMSLLAACVQQSSPGKPSIDPTADSAAVRTSVDRFLAGWNKGDATAFGSMIAKDSILMPPNGPVRRGREAIEADMTKAYDVTKQQQTAIVDEVIVAGDYAYGRGTWNVNPTATVGSDITAMNGKWSILYQRSTDGTWTIARWMWSQDSSPSPTASKPDSR